MSSITAPSKKLAGLGLALATIALLAAALVLPKYAQQTSAALEGSGDGSPDLSKTLPSIGRSSAPAAPAKMAAAKPEAPVRTPVPSPAPPVATSSPRSAIDMTPFHDAMKRGELVEARAFLGANGGEIEPAVLEALKVSLDTADRAQANLAAAESKMATQNAKLTEQIAALTNREQTTGAAPSNENVELPPSFEVGFGHASSRVSKSDREAISACAELLASRPELSVQLRGYADKVGDVKYNALLANARASAVGDVLIDAGIRPSRITSVAFGESQSPGETPASNAGERRVEVRFLAL